MRRHVRYRIQRTITRAGRRLRESGYRQQARQVADGVGMIHRLQVHLLRLRTLNFLRRHAHQVIGSVASRPGVLSMQRKRYRDYVLHGTRVMPWIYGRPSSDVDPYSINKANAR